MLRLEERRQQAIDLKITLPRQLHPLLLDREGSILRELLKARPEHVEDVLAELLLEVRYVEMPGLQLQDHFADQQSVRPHWQRSPQRQLVTVQQAHIVLPGIDVLHVDTIDMAERRNASA